MKKTLALLLVGIMLCLVFAGCAKTAEGTQTSTDASQSAAAGQKTLLRVGLNDACDTLAPWGPMKITKSVVDSSIMQTLAQIDTQTQQMNGVLAKEWKEIDSTTYQVTLYDYIVDTNNNPLKASDAKFSLEKFSQTNTNFIDSITIDNENTFTVKLNTEAPGTFEYLMTTVFVVTEASFNASGDEMSTCPVGTTQYKLVDFTPNAKIVLQKTDSYWQTEELNCPLYGANADYIQYDILTESTQMSLALKQNTVVIGRDIGYSVLAELESAGLTTYMIDDAYSRGVMFNMMEGSPFYDNQALRQAVCYAIDKQAVCNAVTAGYGTVSPVTYGKPSQNGYNAAWETDPYAYDPEKASKLLEEAGYQPGELTITALSNENNDVKTMWEVIQANLSAIGIKLEINFASGSSYGAYRDATSGQYDIAYYGMDYGSYVISSWGTLYDDRIRSSGLTWFGLSDDYVRDMIRTLNTEEGYTQENIDAFYDYTSDQCYYFQMYYQPSACVYNADMVSNVEGATNSRGYTFVNALQLADGWNSYYAG